jgi:hypothetical protein
MTGHIGSFSMFTKSHVHVLAHCSSAAHAHTYMRQSMAGIAGHDKVLIYMHDQQQRFML